MAFHVLIFSEGFGEKKNFGLTSDNKSKLKNESFPNKTIYSSFLSLEASDFKNIIKIYWADFEAAEV